MSSQSDIFSKLANKELIVSKGYINGIFTSGTLIDLFWAIFHDPNNI